MNQRLRYILISAGVGACLGAAWAGLRQRAAVHLPTLQLDGELLAHRPWFYAALGLWVLVSVYWEIAAKDAKVVEAKESVLSRAFHVGLSNIAVLLVMAPFRGLGRLWPVSLPVMAAGLVIEGFGVALAIWARRVLGKNWSGRIAINEDHQLIRSGPYRWMRHPIYTGFLVMIVGAALVTGERLAVAGLILLALAYWRKIRLEEANLRTAFGADYDAYSRDTWALLPGLF